MGRRKNSAEKFHNLARNVDYIWTETNPVPGRLDRTYWTCPKKHICYKSYDSMNRGYRCDTCSGRAILTKDNYHKIADKLGMKWIGKNIPKNNDEKTDWLCSKGHIWNVQYRLLIRRSECAHCFRQRSQKNKLDKEIKKANRKNKTKILQDYIDLANKRGLKFLEKTLPKNSTMKTYWECINGHIKHSSFNTVLSKNSLECQQCKNLTKQDYIETATRKGLIWKGKCLPQNSHTLTDWECKNDHVWSAQYANIQQNKGCPYCRNKNEEECRLIFESLFDDKFPKRKPKWLKLLSGVRNLELDGFNEKLGIAFEYDGGQHFYPVKWWGEKNT